MASNQTKHIGLNQWAAEDAFIREEFNEDNRRIDAEEEHLSKMAEAMCYNLYALALHNELDGAVDDYRQRILLDGFRGGSKVSEQSDTLLMGEKKVQLFRTGQGELFWPWNTLLGSSRPDLTTSEAVATGAGLLTGFRLKIHAESGDAQTAETLWFYRNGVLVQTMEFAVVTTAGTSGARYITVPMGQPVAINPGDRIFFKLKSGNSTRVSYYAESSYKLGGVANIVPAAGTEGVLTAITADVEPYRRGTLYLHHRGGTVTPSLNGQPMDLELTCERVNAMGISCTETCWRTGGGAEPVTLSFTLRLGEGEERCELYDYGFTML